MDEGLREFLKSASLGGGRNFRSIEAYPASRGRTVAPGRVFRSGCLSQLADDFRSQLERLSIRTVVTFQTQQEIDILGDAVADLLPSAVREHIPIGDRWFERGSLVEEELLSMGDFYVAMVSDHGELWARFLRVFSSDNRFPVLYHCTAGRDRTGVATVLLLEALTVPRESIVADYLISNEVFPESEQQAHVLDPLFQAIDREGGIERYLESLGVGRDELEAVRANLLVPESR